jgi:hypothetical protein
MIELQALNKQANNPNAPEQNQVVGELQRLSVSGDWGLYVSRISVYARARKSYGSRHDGRLVEFPWHLLWLFP